MSVHVRIPTPLRRYAGDRASVALEAETLGSLMDALFEECPDLKPHLVGEDAKIRNFVNIFVNGEDTRHLALCPVGHGLPCPPNPGSGSNLRQ